MRWCVCDLAVILNKGIEANDTGGDCYANDHRKLLYFLKQNDGASADAGRVRTDPFALFVVLC